MTNNMTNTQRPMLSPAVPGWINDVKRTSNEDKLSYVRVLLYGEMGSGKTTTAATFPHPFILNTDKGLRTLLDKDIPYLDLSNGEQIYRKIVQVLTDIKRGNLGPMTIETIVIDGFTSLAELMLREIIVENRGPANDPSKEKALFDDYGMLRQRMWSIVTLLQDIPCHVVGTAWATIEKDEISGRFIGRPEMVGKFRETIGGYFDEYYFMECRQGRAGEKPFVYEAHTKPYMWWQARTRNPRLPAVIQDLTFDKIIGGTK